MMQEGSPLKRLAPPLIALLLLGCSTTQRVPPPTPLAGSPTTGQSEVNPGTGVAQTDPTNGHAQPDLRPDLLADSGNLSLIELQQGLLRLVEAPGTTIPAQLQRLVGRWLPQNSPWIEADLDGDGALEYALALSAKDQPAALFVIDHREGRYQVDLDPLAAQSTELMGAHLHSAADLTGEGRPQLIWYRPELIASGPQPYAVFVTQWEPGRFTHLPGPMVISNLALNVEGKELRLTGVSRAGRLLWPRTDTYRFTDGAFRLVDRQFEGERTYGYDRFWDAVVSEGLGQLDEAEAAYLAVLEEGRPAHPGSYSRYNSPPLEPSAADLAAFDAALRTFAQFRLKAMGRPSAGVDSPYAGLLQAEGCQAAAAWAEQHPAFLEALNRSITHAPWTAADLCAYPALDEVIE